MNRRTYRRQRERGIVIVMVVAVLTLAVILGTAYLQLARAGRTAAEVRTGSNIDQVANSVVLYIGDVLANDLLDSSDPALLFNPAEDEPYDYPWTDQTASFPVEDFLGNALGNADGGTLDDTWLAALVPDFSTLAKPEWPHITNLYGRFLRLPKVGNPSASQQPAEVQVDNGSFLRRDTDVKITGDTQALDTSSSSTYENLGTDTDGDGVPDARWVWAPLRVINGIAYVMAVRIIDNSGMINLNAATAMTSDGDNTWGASTDNPRGYFPTCLDLSRLLKRFDAANWDSGSLFRSELLAMLGNRNVDTSNITPFGLSSWPNAYPNAGTYTTSPFGRVGSWLDHVSLYGYSANFLDTSDEMELRYHGGLTDEVSQTTVDTLMPGLLRDGAVETSFADVVGGSSTSDMRKYFQGGTGDIDTARDFPGVRHFLTTISGANVYANNYKTTASDTVGLHAGARTLKYDLVYQDGGADGGTPDDRISNVATLLANILKIDTPTYLGLTDSELDQVAGEYALAIQDYADSDHNPSFAWIDDGDMSQEPGETFYGLEVLPFIREVYLQIAYQDSDLDDPGMPGPHPNGTPDGDFDTWVRDDASRAMVVEIGNPFDRPITTAMLDDRIQIAVRDPSDAVGTYVATYTFDNTAPDIPSMGNLLVYSNAASGHREDDTGGGTGPGTDLPADLQFSAATPTPVDAGAGTLIFKISSDQIDGDNITIELRVNTDPGGMANWVTYDRFKLTEIGGGSNEVDVPATIGHNPEDTTARHRHVQLSFARDARAVNTRTIRFISNSGKDLLSVRQHPDTSGTSNVPIDWTPGTPSTADYRRKSNSPVDALTLDTKTIPTPSKTIDRGSTDLDLFQIAIANRPFFSIAELGWIHMFGFSDGNAANIADAGDFPERLDSLLGLRQFLTVGSGASVPDATGIPHAGMVFEQFTTLSPRYDGLDNDNADQDGNSATGADDDDEAFVRGQININTMPLHLLVTAVPMPEIIDDIQAVFEHIVDYRDNPANRDSPNLTPMTGLRTAEGIENISEVLLVNPNLVAGGSNYEEDMVRYGLSGAGAQPAEMDLYPMFEQTTATAYANQMLVEGQMARFQFIGQAFTTRSDNFTAYVEVRGYPAEDFRLGPVETKRFIAVYDRSNIKTSADRPKVLAISERN